MYAVATYIAFNLSHSSWVLLAKGEDIKVYSLKKMILRLEKRDTFSLLYCTVDITSLPANSGKECCIVLL
jgi:hypothetical protein